MPAIYPDGAETEIILDYLTLTDEWIHHIIGIGRRRGPFEVRSEPEDLLSPFLPDRFPKEPRGCLRGRDSGGRRAADRL